MDWIVFVFAECLVLAAKRESSHRAESEGFAIAIQRPSRA
jgi:hypothetical protein